MAELHPSVVQLFVAGLQAVTQLTDFVLEVAALGLVADSHFAHIAVDHALSLTVHHRAHVLELFSFAPLAGGVPCLPGIQLHLQVGVAGPLNLVLISGTEVDIAELPLHILELAVELMAHEIEFFVLLTIPLFVPLMSQHLLAHLPEQNIGAAGRNGLPFQVPYALLPRFDLFPQAFDLHGLEDHDEGQIIREVDLAVGLDLVLDVRSG